ncbi:MAG: hypothetical protein RR360_06455, partial [Raoultibacter sp.]
VKPVSDFLTVEPAAQKILQLYPLALCKMGIRHSLPPSSCPSRQGVRVKAMLSDFFHYENTPGTQAEKLLRPVTGSACKTQCSFKDRTCNKEFKLLNAFARLGLVVQEMCFAHSMVKWMREKSSE